MKRFLNYQILLLVSVSVILFSSCDVNQAAQEQPDNNDDGLAGWNLVWQDEFEGNEVDTSKWEFQIGDGSAYGIPGWGNKELQNYTGRPENAYISNGHLVMVARKETFVGPERTSEYTSVRLRTAEKGDWKYGRFDIRAKPPEGQGIWPAIWMLSTDWTYGGWATSGEIDIMEMKGHERNIVHGTLHYGGQWPNNVYTGIEDTLETGVYTDDFHLFTLEWDTTEIRWYIDGKNYQSQTQWHSKQAPYPAPFDQRFHLLLNIAVGGRFPGNPDSTTVFPQTMEVDYVRVYQRKK